MKIRKKTLQPMKICKNSSQPGIESETTGIWFEQ
jgi:hypothetical protein